MPTLACEMFILVTSILSGYFVAPVDDTELSGTSGAAGTVFIATTEESAKNNLLMNIKAVHWGNLQ